MPLTAKGKKILSAMNKTYGERKAKKVFYASINDGKITGAERSSSPRGAEGKTRKKKRKK